ncbi:MAG: response regulator [Verrucomicrobia bacterium]|nr:response regulator [Verrucomicrobiota bacterium]
MSEPIPILVVDDRANNLAVVQSVLDSPDYHLVMVQSAQDALMALLHTEFAALLLDVKMPEITGFDLARIIHERKASRHLPIIFISGHMTDSQHAKLGYKAGGVDYITKPFDPEVLRAKVAVFADLYRQRQALTAEAAALRGENVQLRQGGAAQNPKENTAAPGK